MPRIVRKGSRSGFFKESKVKVIGLGCTENRSTEKRKSMADSEVLPLQEMDPNNIQKRHCPMQVQDSWNPMTYSNPMAKHLEDIGRSDRGRLYLRCASTHARDPNNFRTRNDTIIVTKPRPSPLPEMQWADSAEVWLNMLRKEALHVRNPSMFSRHSDLQPRMRSIVLDWLGEVCQMYRMHRETYYLAMDFVDRYLGVVRDVKQNELQLIGASALFIAAKAEEIYPPKLTEFAYVTDGACSAKSIIAMEKKILEALKWDLTPVTPNSWLTMLLQLVNAGVYGSQITEDFLLPHFAVKSFVQIMRLLDVCTKDEGSLQFPYSVLATSAVFYLAEEPEDALIISSYQYGEIETCIHWMKPFAQTISELECLEVQSFPNVPSHDAHNIHTHDAGISLFEKAKLRQQQPIVFQEEEEGNSSPELGQHDVITPQKPRTVEYVIS